jgi:hypothetical protein
VIAVGVDEASTKSNAAFERQTCLDSVRHENLFHSHVSLGSGPSLRTAASRYQHYGQITENPMTTSNGSYIAIASFFDALSEEKSESIADVRME